MKHILPILSAAILSGAAILTGCDSVSEPDRLVPAEIPAMRSILIEEFTGQLCTNCPDGHAMIKDILSTSIGDSIVPVCIHASSQAVSVEDGGLKIEAGDEYYKNVGNPALPTAVIDMVTKPLMVAEWGASINHLIMEPTPYTVIANTSVADNKLNIDVAFSAGEDFSGNLLVWVCENDVVGAQLDHGTFIYDYVHQHVLRAVANGVWGDPVTLKSGEPQYKTLSVEIDPLWNAENVYAVAFLYNNGGVAQVASSSHSH